MKQSILVWSRVRQYVQTNPVAFIFYMLGSIVCSLILIYVYGNTVPAFKVITGNDELYRSYRIEQFESESLDMKVLESMAENWPFTGVWQDPSILLQKKSAKDVFSDVDFSGYQFVTPMIEAEYNNQIDLYAVQGRVQFDESDLNAPNPPIILPSELTLKDFNSSIFHIADKPFTVIGRYSGIFSVVIPIQAFLKLTEQPDFIVVRFAKTDNDLQMQDKISEHLQQYFPGAFVHPPFYMGLNPTETNIISALLAILYALALASITFISKYLFEQNRSANTIYRLAGCSGRQLAHIILLESSFLAIVTLAVAFGLHQLLYTSVFVRLNLSPEIVYTTADYIRLALIIAVVTVLLSQLNQRCLIKNTIVKNYL